MNAQREHGVMRGPVVSRDLVPVLVLPAVPHSVPLSSNSQTQEPLGPLEELPCPTTDLLSWNCCHVGR